MRDYAVYDGKSIVSTHGSYAAAMNQAAKIKSGKGEVLSAVKHAGKHEIYTTTDGVEWQVFHAPKETGCHFITDGGKLLETIF